MAENTNVTRRDLVAGMGMLSFVGAMGGMSFAGTAQATEAPAGQPSIEEIQAAEIAAAKAENRRLDPVKYVTTLSHSQLEDMLADEAEVTEDYVTPNGKVIPAVYVALRNRINRCGGGIGSIVSGDDHWDVYMNFWTEDDARHTLEMPMNKWFIANEECDCRLGTCTSMGEIAEYFISCGAAREVTKEEARAIIQANVDEGNTIEAFCNKSGGAWRSCNADCCQFAAAYRAFGGALNSMPFISDYNLKYDKDACLKCGACQTRCPMDAIEVDEEGFFVATNMCFRCGQCGMTCPVGARKLVLKEKWETFEWGADVVDDCLTAAKLHMALGGVVDFTGDVDAVREACTFKVI